MNESFKQTQAAEKPDVNAENRGDPEATFGQVTRNVIGEAQAEVSALQKATPFKNLEGQLNSSEQTAVQSSDAEVDAALDELVTAVDVLKTEYSVPPIESPVTKPQTTEELKIALQPTIMGKVIELDKDGMIASIDQFVSASDDETLHELANKLKAVELRRYHVENAERTIRKEKEIKQKLAELPSVSDIVSTINDGDSSENSEMNNIRIFFAENKNKQFVDPISGEVFEVVKIDLLENKVIFQSGTNSIALKFSYLDEAELYGGHFRVLDEGDPTAGDIDELISTKDEIKQAIYLDQPQFAEKLPNDFEERKLALPSEYYLGALSYAADIPPVTIANIENLSAITFTGQTVSEQIGRYTPTNKTVTIKYDLPSAEAVQAALGHELAHFTEDSVKDKKMEVITSFHEKFAKLKILLQNEQFYSGPFGGIDRQHDFLSSSSEFLAEIIKDLSLGKEAELRFFAQKTESPQARALYLSAIDDAKTIAYF